MIISALVQRYEDIDIPIGWQHRDVSYGIEIDENGRLLNILSLETSELKGKKSILRRSRLLLPLERIRASNASKIANFLADNGGYMLGLDSVKFESAKKFHNKLLASIDTPQSRAILAYFDNDAKQHLEHTKAIKNPEQANYIFYFNGKRLDYFDEPLRKAWDQYYAVKDDDLDEDNRIRCLVTGQRDTPLYAHNYIRLLYAEKRGPLIGVNWDSFTSYGKGKDDRASEVGKYAAFAYHTALSNLLWDEKHHKRLGEDTLLFWAEKGGENCENLFSNLCDPPNIDEDSELSEIVNRISSGQMVSFDKDDFARKFFILCLAPNAARISVRFFHTDTFGNLVHHLQDHYERLAIVGDGRNKFALLPLWVILSETTIKKSAQDAHPLLAGQLLRQVLLGLPYPLTLYHAMLGRVKAGEEINQCKAAVIKAILIKNFNEKEVTTVALNEQSLNKPYILGRLFSTLERLQERANKNATIRERYFSSACANPASVFPTLLKLSFHHIAKLDNAVFFEKLIGDLLSCMVDEEPFPTTLNLEDQGRFILGYYHQRQAFFTAKMEKEESNDE